MRERISAPGLAPWGDAFELRVGEKHQVYARPFEEPGNGMLEVRATAAGMLRAARGLEFAHSRENFLKRIHIPQAHIVPFFGISLESPDRHSQFIIHRHAFENAVPREQRTFTQTFAQRRTGAA